MQHKRNSKTAQWLKKVKQKRSHQIMCQNISANAALARKEEHIINPEQSVSADSLMQLETTMFNILYFCYLLMLIIYAYFGSEQQCD